MVMTVSSQPGNSNVFEFQDPWTPKLELLIFCGLVPILCGHDGMSAELPS
jgi:hypothetical protein